VFLACQLMIVRTMENRTIAKAVIEVLQTSKKPMTVPEITQAILEQNLFTFNSKNPQGIVRGAIERRCEGLARKDTIEPKYFRKHEGRLYSLTS